MKTCVGEFAEKCSLLVFLLTVLAPLSCRAAETNRFLSAGIPTSDREWGGQDYLLAAQIFSSGVPELPRFSDTDGALLLARLTSTNNFAVSRNPTLPIAMRLQDSLAILKGANAIMKLYYLEVTRGEKVHREVAQMAAFLVKTAGVGMDLIYQFVPTIPKDEKYPVRMEALKTSCSGVTDMFAGYVSTLSDTNFYSNEDRSRILEAIADALPNVNEAFSPGFRIELRGKFETLAPTFSGNQDIQRLKRIMVELDH